MKSKILYPILGLLCAMCVLYLGNYFILLKNENAKKNQQPVDLLDYHSSEFEMPSFLPTPHETASVSALKIPIIMYHYVEYVKDRRDAVRIKLNTTPADFEEQLRELKDAGYESYFMRDIPDLLSSKKYYTDRSIVLTFDDGYEDFYINAFPLLKKYNIRATVYIITDLIGEKGFLHKEQIRELIRSGLIEIGSHTLSHPYLKTTDDEESRRQIFQSKKKLEKEFGIEIESFAYPYGAMNPSTVLQVKEAGYTNAASVIFGSIQSADNLFFLFRIRPEIFGAKGVVTTIKELKK